MAHDFYQKVFETGEKIINNSPDIFGNVIQANVGK